MKSGFTLTTDTVRRPAFIVWGLLVVATAISWWLGLHHGITYTAVTVAGAIILAVTFLKIHLVGMYFMEVRSAPRILIWIFVAWTVTTCAATLSLYIFAAYL